MLNLKLISFNINDAALDLVPSAEDVLADLTVEKAEQFGLSMGEAFIRMAIEKGKIRDVLRSNYIKRSLWQKEIARPWSLTQPAVTEDRIFVGSAGRKLHVLDRASGEELWEFSAEGRVSAPAVADGVVYFGSHDKHLYAVDIETRELVWKFKTGGQVCDKPRIKDGVVYFGSMDGRLYAIDINEAVEAAADERPVEEKWEVRTSDCVHGTPAVEGDQVYFGSLDGKFRAVKKEDGAKVWAREFGVQMSPVPVVWEDKVYFGAYQGFYCLRTSNGDQVWSKTEDKVFFGDAVIDNGIACFKGGDGSFRAINAEDGAEVWEAEVGGSEPVKEGNYLYFGSGTQIYALDLRDGKLRWQYNQYNIGDKKAAKLIVADGIVYVGSDAGILYALDAETGEDGQGLLVSQAKLENFRKTREERRPVVINELGDQLKDPDPILRRQAVEVLGRCFWREGGQQLIIDHLDHEEDPNVIAAARKVFQENA